MSTFTAIPAAGAKLRGSILSALVTEVRPLWAEVGTDQPLATSSTTLVNVTDLVLPVAANTKYRFWLTLVYTLSSGSTEDIKAAVAYPTGAVVDFGGSGANTTATTTAGDGEFIRRLAATSGVTSTPYGASASGPMNAIVMIKVTTGANAGNIQIMCAQQTSGANTVTVKAGSTLEGHQVT